MDVERQGSSSKHEMGGWLGGVTAGYNVQMGRVVAGVEVDWSWGEAGIFTRQPGFGCDGSLCHERRSRSEPFVDDWATRLIECSPT